ncbi:peptidoglycan-binding protein [Candidatus Omnitrophota bacterium]
MHVLLRNIEKQIVCLMPILTLIVLISFSGCDYIYGLLDKEGAEEKEIIGELIPFEENLVVEDIQMLLSLYGFSPGQIDGTMGRRTRDAVARFRREVGLVDGRKVDQLTWEALTRLRKLGLVDNNEINVSLMQELLAAAGFDPGKIDGHFGPRTKRTVKAFQKAQGLKADGKVGFKTLTALAEFLNMDQGKDRDDE